MTGQNLPGCGFQVCSDFLLVYVLLGCLLSVIFSLVAVILVNNNAIDGGGGGGLGAPNSKCYIIKSM